MKKKGISAIVATILIVLITVAAVTIIWVAIIPMIFESASFHDPDLRLNIVTSRGYTVYDPDLSYASVQVSRGTDEADLLGVELIFGFEGNSVRHFVEDSPEPNGIIVYYVNLSGYPAPTSVGVVPVFSDGEIGSLLSEFDFDFPEGDLAKFAEEVEVLNGGYTGGSTGSGGSGGSGEEVPDCIVAADCISPGVCKILEGASCVGGSCVYQNADDGTGCNDGDSNTENDECTGGVCSGTAIPETSCTNGIQDVGDGEDGI